MVSHVTLEFELQLVRIVIYYKIKINISKNPLKWCESWNCQYACHQKKFTDYHNLFGGGYKRWRYPIQIENNVA